MAAEEQYIVSARKYRPQTFDTVVGQEHITTTLKNAIRSGHLAHAYLFCGPRGVGKTTCARILARTLNCEHPTEDMEACGVCETCKAFENNSSLNIFELDAASNNSVEDIRRLSEQIRYAPQHGKYKIYIIDEVHMLSSAAFNAFLKTLEEPPSYAIFILATTEKHKILPTILSRCQIFDFKRIKPKAIVEHLEAIAAKEGYEAESTALHVIAQKSEGCMRDALSIMDRLVSFANGKLTYDQVIKHLNILDATTYFRLSEMLWVKDIGGALLLLDDLLQKGFEGDLIINGFSEHFRNLLLCKDVKMARLLELPEAHKRRYYEHAQMLADSYIISALSVLNQAELNYKTALNKRLHVELCLIKLCYLTDLVLPGNLIPNPGTQNPEVKKKLTNPLPASQPAPLPIEPQKNVITEQPTAPAAANPNHEVAHEPDSHSIALGQPKKTGSPLQPEPPNQSSGSSLSKIPKAGAGLKLSSNFLQNLQEKNKAQNEVEVIIPTQELIQKIFDRLKEGYHTTNLLLCEQMEMMSVALVSNEEIHLICSSEINFAYGKDLTKALRAAIRKETHQKTLRVITQYNPEAVRKEPTEKVKSRQEIFEDFLEKSPALKKLKGDLNLGIDY